MQGFVRQHRSSFCFNSSCHDSGGGKVRNGVHFDRAWIVLLLITNPTPVSGQAADTDRMAGIYGHVRDSLNAPVTNVVVTLEEAELSRLTNERGFFAFDSLPPGIEIVRFEHVAYDDREVPVALTPGRATRLQVRLQTAVLEVEPLEVLVQGTWRLRQMRGFERRREMRSGLFYDIEDLKKTTVPRVVTLLREVPGLRIDHRELHPPYTGSLRASMRGSGCSITVWVNGFMRIGGVRWLQELSPGQVEAVEIYKKGQIPAEYGEADCIAIAIWTRWRG